jgi:hypothetical protein
MNLSLPQVLGVALACILGYFGGRLTGTGRPKATRVK